MPSAAASNDEDCPAANAPSSIEASETSLTKDATPTANPAMTPPRFLPRWNSRGFDTKPMAPRPSLVAERIGLTPSTNLCACVWVTSSSQLLMASSIMLPTPKMPVRRMGCMSRRTPSHGTRLRASRRLPARKASMSTWRPQYSNRRESLPTSIF